MLAPHRTAQLTAQSLFTGNPIANTWNARVRAEGTELLHRWSWYGLPTMVKTELLGQEASKVINDGHMVWRRESAVSHILYVINMSEVRGQSQQREQRMMILSTPTFLEKRSSK